MSPLDHYVVLGVPRTATAAEVKGAYRRLAHRYHPDKNGGDPDTTRRFQAIVAAYQVLNDPEARAAYDRRHPVAGAVAATATRAPRPPGPAGAGAPPGRTVGPVGEALHVTAHVDLAEVLTGTERTIRPERRNSCAACRGSGASARSGWKQCHHCRGLGHSEDVEGVFAYRRVCLHCHGSGQTVTRPCPTCVGAGVVPTRTTLRVRIPSGVDTGSVIRFAHQGHAGPFGGPRGDLRLRIAVNPHPTLTREGPDLRHTLRLTPWQAALGAVVAVVVLDGTLTLRVRPGIQPEAVLRVPGRGLPREPNGDVRGDCYVRFRIAVPKNLRADQRAVYERLAALDGGVGAHPPTLWQRLRRLGRRPRP